jgi:anti-sigma factor RsiW
MTDHDLHPRDDDPADLLGAYVLDAVDDTDRRRVEELLAADPGARGEAARLDAVADQLAEAAAAGVTAPDHLLGSILAGVADRPAGGPVPDQTATDEPDAGRAEPGAADVVPFERRGARRPRGAWILSAAAVLVLVVVGGLFVANRSGDDDVSPEVAMERLAREAATLPGSRTGELTDPDRTMAVPVVVDPQGHAFLMAGVLPTLDAEHTYQLWAAEGDTMISLGLLGHDPTMAVVGVDPAVTVLALTVEPVGGSPGPTSDPMAQGTLSQA